VQSPDTINLDVKTAVFPATFAPNETGNSIADLDALSSSYDEDNKDLNIPTISNDAADFMKADFSEANTIDISNISLDLNDEPAEAAAEEPADVETKLELVAAYIDMDDAEGAKELIAEVVAEGGPNQRKRAEALLAKLG
jgi:pilus assembly protein FimV